MHFSQNTTRGLYHKASRTRRGFEDELIMLGSAQFDVQEEAYEQISVGFQLSVAGRSAGRRGEGHEVFRCDKLSFLRQHSKGH